MTKGRKHKRQRWRVFADGTEILSSNIIYQTTAITVEKQPLKGIITMPPFFPSQRWLAYSDPSTMIGPLSPSFVSRTVILRSNKV